MDIRGLIARTKALRPVSKHLYGRQLDFLEERLHKTPEEMLLAGPKFYDEQIRAIYGDTVTPRRINEKLVALMIYWRLDSIRREDNWELYTEWSQYSRRIQNDVKNIYEKSTTEIFIPLYMLRRTVQDVKDYAHLHAVVAALAIHIEAPIRNDLGKCRVFEEAPPGDEFDATNRIVLSEATLYIAHHKTKTYRGTITHTLSPETIGFIRRSLTLQPREYLILSPRKKPMGDAYKEWFSSHMSALLGTHTTINCLRKAWATAQNAAERVNKEQTEIAHKMGNTIRTLLEVYDLRAAPKVWPWAHEKAFLEEVEMRAQFPDRFSKKRVSPINKK
jgi:integrase